ncbi:MAG TPA: ABC transporter permease [Vicinamibacterales bacterium]|nr:ABC transporter permease [Vicinamibacterales bacterium]
MTTIRRFVLRLLSFFRLEAAEAELSREIHSHLQLLEDEFVSKGMPRDDARLAARRAFGGVEQAKEHQRDARGFRWLDNSRMDFKLGARMLVKYPALSLIGGAGLAVGVAIGAGFFTLLYSFLYATVPVEGGDRIVALENWDTDTNNEMQRSMHDLLIWQREMKTVEEIGAFRSIERNLIVPGGPAEPVQVAQITAAGFNITRVPPVIGRPIIAADENASAMPIAIVGHDVWQSRFGGDASVLGRELRLGNVVHTIVGVMPEGYGFPVNHSYWIPLKVDLSIGPREGPDIFIFGRLRDGVAMEQAQAELSGLGAQAASAFPSTHARLQPRVMPYAHTILDIQGAALEFMALQSITSLFAVIVAINVGVLVYARTAMRQREIAVRTAIGASRRRIVGQLFIEALVLSGVASAAGIGLARFGISQGYAIFAAEGNGRLPYFLDLSMPFATYIYVALLTLFAAVMAGVLPAVYATGRAQETLKQSSGTDGLRLGRVWTVMIVAQVAIAMVGLPATATISWGGIENSFTKANFREEAFLAAIVSVDPDAPTGVPQSIYASESVLRFEKTKTDLVLGLEAEPAVEDVTVAEYIPGSERWARIAIDGTAAPQSGAVRARVNRVATDFFEAFGARVTAGRALRDGDGTGSAQAIVVNRAFVEQLLGDTHAIGRRVQYVEAGALASTDGARAAQYEIVGVMSDLSTNAVDPELIEPVIYHPLRSSTRATALIRMRGTDPLQFSSRIRELTAALDPTMRLRIVTFNELKQQAQIALRLMVLGCSLMIVTALLLSAAGIYAMMSFTVSQRRKEIGIRAAMGADAGQLLRSIFAKAALQLSTGVVVGIVLAIAIDWASGGELLGSFGRGLVPVTALIMTIVGLFATIGPARRGLRIQPTEALRAE